MVGYSLRVAANHLLLKFLSYIWPKLLSNRSKRLLGRTIPHSISILSQTNTLNTRAAAPNSPDTKPNSSAPSAPLPRHERQLSSGGPLLNSLQRAAPSAPQRCRHSLLHTKLHRHLQRQVCRSRARAARALYTNSNHHLSIWSSNMQTRPVGQITNRHAKLPRLTSSQYSTQTAAVGRRAGVEIIRLHATADCMTTRVNSRTQKPHETERDRSIIKLRKLHPNRVTGCPRPINDTHTTRSH